MEPSALAAAAAEPAHANDFSSADFDEAADRRPESHRKRIRARRDSGQLHESCKSKLPAAQLHSACASIADLMTPPTLPRGNAAIGATRGVLSSRERCRCEPTSECSTASQDDAKLHSGAELHSPTRSAILAPRPGMMRDDYASEDDRSSNHGNMRAIRGLTECSSAPECSTAAQSCSRLRKRVCTMEHADTPPVKKRRLHQQHRTGPRGRQRSGGLFGASSAALRRRV
eukprot:161365-Prymnesium_polylepis.1